jgi:hypothetical protein
MPTVADATKQLRHALAQARVRRAMILVEDAQRRLGMAMSELSTLQYGAPAHGRVGKLYDRVHAEWYRLQNLFGDDRILLDREPTEEERTADLARRAA